MQQASLEIQRWEVLQPTVKKRLNEKHSRVFMQSKYRKYCYNSRTIMHENKWLWHNLHLKYLMLYNRLFLEPDIMAVKPNRLVHYGRGRAASKCDDVRSQRVTILRNSCFLCIIHVGGTTDLKTLNQISTYWCKARKSGIKLLIVWPCNLFYSFALVTGRPQAL